MTAQLAIPSRSPDTMIGGNSLLRLSAQARHAGACYREQCRANAQRAERLQTEISERQADVEARGGDREKAALDVANQKQLAWLRLEARALRALATSLTTRHPSTVPNA